LRDNDRERLERARARAAVQMSAERERIDRTRARDDERRLRLGPRDVVGPDGIVVTLYVGKSGLTLVDLGDGSADIWSVAVGLAISVLGIIVHLVIFRGGSTLYISPASKDQHPARKDRPATKDERPAGSDGIKVRMRSRAAAADLLREVATALEQEGVSALRRWAGGRSSRATTS
jgi:hypothetical protein